MHKGNILELNSPEVYRDFNANGAFDSTATFKEIGLSSITVTAYNASGASVGTATTNSTGNYTIPSVSGAVRVEFTGIGTGDYSGPKGTGSNTSIQFVTAPVTSINFGVNYPQDFCQASPQVIVPCYVGRDLTGPNAAEPALVRFNNYGNDKYIGQAGYTGPTKITDHQHLGATYGVAYSRITKKAFVGAVLRRHVPYGPQGIGGIYEVDPLTGTVNNWLNIETLAGIDAGTDTRNATTLNSISATKNYDYAAFAQIGKQSLGDVEISDDGKTLFVINLFQQSLVAIDVATKTLVGSYPITASALSLSCPQSDFRPWGLKYHKGKLYVGAVCSAQSTQAASDMKAYVLEFDPANTGAGFSIYYSFALNYTRENNTTDSWHPWNEKSFDPGSNNPSPVDPTFNDDARNAQAILSDIEFDVDGSLILGLMDRHGMMFSSGNAPPDPAATSTASTGAFTNADILRVCNTSTGFVLECTKHFTWTGGGEFYDDKRQGGNGTSQVKEVAGGALAFLAGSGEIVSTAIDEFDVFENGIAWWNNTSGVRNRAYMILDKNVPGSQQKTSGLGDIELLCDAAPIEVGNRVWTDTDKDGIQDADEAGIDGVTVKLFEGTTEVGSTTTANGGQYYFTNTNVTGGVKYSTAYEIRIATAQPPLSTLSLTTTDVNSNGSDLIDNDGITSGANVIKAFTTGNAGANNHSYDFGFSSFSFCDTTLVVTNATICNGVTVDLFTLASGVKGTLTYSTNGTTWVALTSPTNVTPSVTTTYYVKDTLTGGCFDIDTLVITVNPQPTPPAVSSPIMNICPLTTVDLTTISSALTPSVSGGVFEWHVSNSSSSAMVSNQNTVVAGDYYLFERSPAGCYSTGLKVTVVIQVCCPTPLCIPVTVTRN